MAGFNITGSVTNSVGGAGFQGVTITAIDSLGDSAATTTTDASGNYSLQPSDRSVCGH